LLEALIFNNILKIIYLNKLFYKVSIVYRVYNLVFILKNK
jgi:hypothetical protein